MVYKRLSKSKIVDKIIILTSENPKDDELCSYLEKNEIPFFRGCENNVFKRFSDASKKFKPTLILRITADCPLVDAEIVDSCIKLLREEGSDYCLIQCQKHSQMELMLKFSSLLCLIKNG